jgi:hypothetical protein
MAAGAGCGKAARGRHEGVGRWAESGKIKAYRETLHELARPQPAWRKREPEGKAAKLGTEIHGEERKGQPKIRLGGKPRR